MRNRERDWRSLGWRLGAAVVLAALVLPIPYQYKAFEVGRFTEVIALAVAALGLNLLTGYNGQISVGHGAFFGLGAYGTAVLVADHHLPHLVAIAAIAVVAFAVGVVVGLPALRIKGLYLAVVTLALATMFPSLIKHYESITGGSTGKRMPKFRAPDWTGLDDDQWRFYVALAVLVLAFVLVRNLVQSRVGRALVAARDNEVAAEVLGVDLAAYKVLTFGISALLAAVGGSIWILEKSFASPQDFQIKLSIELLVAVVVGGAATIAGPVIGAYAVVFMEEWVKDLGLDPILTPVIFGSLLVLLMVTSPGGVVGLVRSTRDWLRRRWPGRHHASPPGGASGTVPRDPEPA